MPAGEQYYQDGHFVPSDYFSRFYVNEDYKKAVSKGVDENANYADRRAFPVVKVHLNQEVTQSKSSIKRTIKMAMNKTLFTSRASPLNPACIGWVFYHILF